MTTPSVHVKSFAAVPPAYESELGSVTQLDATALPILSGLSMKRIILEPGAIREPQWNVNANQLAYCISGTVLVATLGNSDSFSSFVVSPGQMYHVESGAIYHIENVGNSRAELILALRSEHPQHFSLRDSFSAMTDAVLGNCYDLPSSAFAAFDRSPASQIVRREGAADIPSTAGLPNARLFDLESQNAPISYAYGYAKLARKQFWAALDDLSMYALQVKENGMREPHWHPITAEMGYVAKGHARMRVLDPDGTLDEYLLSPGDVYFVPRAYPHHIEDVGQDDINFLIFFDQPTPGDIGYRATASAFSREALAASFGIRERDLPQFPFTPMDPLIVARSNPVDPVT
jgi:oxalate decarboxylase